MHELELERDALLKDPYRLRILFEEMVQMCLWYEDVRHCSHMIFKSLPNSSGEMQL